MMCVEASIHGSEPLRLGVVDSGLLAGRSQREIFGKRRIRSRLAEIGIFRRADIRRDPDSSRLVHHWIMRPPHTGPHDLIGVIWRWDRDLFRPCGCHGRPVSNGRNLDGACGILDRVDPQQIVIVVIGGVNQTVGIHRWVALVCADLVMRVSRGLSPIPHRDHHIALRTLRTRRRGWQLAGGDAIRPVRKHLDGSLLVDKAGKGVAHPVGTRLAEMYARSPCFLGRLVLESGQVREVPGDLVAKLVALLAALFHHVNPLFLIVDGTQRKGFLIRYRLLVGHAALPLRNRRNRVWRRWARSSGFSLVWGHSRGLHGKLILVWYFYERKPIDGGIVFRGILL